MGAVVPEALAAAERLGHPHTLAFLSTINHVPHAALGVDRFGQSGSIEDLYRHHGIDTDSIIRAALDLLP